MGGVVAGGGAASVGYCFPATRRLRGADHFERVFRCGARRTGRFFVLHAARANDGLGALGLVVGKRVTGNNVLRNRVKRLIREVFRYSSLRCGCFDVVVRLRAKPDEAQWVQARDELVRLLGEVS